MREYLSAIAKALAPAVAATIMIIGVATLGLYAQTAAALTESVIAIGQVMLFVGFMVAVHLLVKE